MALEARGVGYVYDAGTSFARRALRAVDLTVDRGELILVAGATGSGKSTLLRLCAGLLVPTEGEVLVDGADIRASRPDTGGLVGIVFQDPEAQLFAETVLADVVFGPRNLGASNEEAERAALDALAAVGLEPEVFSGRSPFTLSGGEARRVGIAGVLAMRPEYLLLDEPTAGLDAGGRAAVLHAVERTRERAGVVVVTHDPEELLPNADRMLVLRDGGVSVSGTVAEVIDDCEGLEAADVRLPEVVRAQLLSERSGRPVPRPYALDPLAAARVLAVAGGWAT